MKSFKINFLYCLPDTLLVESEELSMTDEDIVFYFPLGIPKKKNTRTVCDAHGSHSMGPTLSVKSCESFASQS